RVHRLCTRVVSRAPVLIQRFFAPVLLRPPRSAHFPYTTLFRSVVRIPRVFDELTTSQVLTEQRARGLRITAAAALDAAGVDRPALARAATRTIVQMVLVDGFFHADPHPGNMFVREDGALWLIDFGMAGELSPTEREDIVRLTFALSRDDADGV